VNSRIHPSEGLFTPLPVCDCRIGADRDSKSLPLAEALIRTLALGATLASCLFGPPTWNHAQGLGQRITIRVSPETQEPVSGVFEDIGEDGALFLRLDDGTVEPPDCR